MILHETDNFDEINLMFNILLKTNKFTKGDAPKIKDSVSFISYVLIHNDEDYIDCEYRYKKDETEILTDEESFIKHKKFNYDDVPF